MVHYEGGSVYLFKFLTREGLHKILFKLFPQQMLNELI